MVIKVKYKNNRFDLVKGEMLDLLLEEGKIKQFYRYSENKWITVGRDPVRAGRKTFQGTERRAHESERMSLQ
ncbi:MAG: hypothetical protein OEW04_09860 [Nitrospirota bacterium]|nr:hypothetical protein [Nitrospirota bacterium]